MADLKDDSSMKPEKLDGKDIFCSGAKKTCTADHDIAQIKSVDMVCFNEEEMRSWVDGSTRV